jgi:serine/threonine protein kinase
MFTASWKPTSEVLPSYSGNLLEKIVKGRFSERQSLEIIYRIVKGLAYLESKDIIHRDLKPENIIFKSKTNPYEVVIVDFGFATKVEDYKNLFVRCGTPGYVAPEVLNDFPYTTKADVFSAGIILYILYALLTQPLRLRALLRRRLR